MLYYFVSKGRGRISRLRDIYHANFQLALHKIIYVRLTENKPGICLAAMKYGDDRWIRDSIARRWIRDSIARSGDETANFLKNF